MWYYDTMEPEGGGQDKAKGLLALDIYMQQERTYPAWRHCCREVGRLFLLIFELRPKKVLPSQP